jgi:cytochrome c6
MTKLVKTITLGALTLGLALPTLSFAADTGADTFKSKCAMCHGENGVGKGKIPALSSPEVQKKADADFRTTIEKGTKTANGMMPGYSGKLTPEQIDALVGYVRSLKK